MLPLVRGRAPRRSVRAWTIAVLGIVLVLPLLLQIPASSSAPRDPSQDLPRPPAKCLLESGAISPDVRPCFIGRYRPHRPTLVLWGDSHAIQMLPAVRRAAAGRRVNLAMFALGACPPLLFNRAPARSSAVCKSFNADALDFVTGLQDKGKRVRVILGGHWQAYRRLHRLLFVKKSLDRREVRGFVVETARIFPRRAPALMRRLGRRGVAVDVIGQTATVPERIRGCAAGEEPYVCDIERRRALPAERATRGYLRRSMRPLNRDARLISVNRAICNASVCKGRKRGIYTFFNDLHISATRARTMKRFFVPSLRSLTR